LDIIPITCSAYHTAQIEDGVVLADSELRLKIAAQYPDAWSRIQQRRSMVTKIPVCAVSARSMP